MLKRPAEYGGSLVGRQDLLLHVVGLLGRTAGGGVHSMVSLPVDHAGLRQTVVDFKDEKSRILKVTISRAVNRVIEGTTAEETGVDEQSDGPGRRKLNWAWTKELPS